MAQVITRMIVGGAQENTLATARAFGAHPDYDVTLITGPGLGPEGNLLETLQSEEPFRLVLIPQLRRKINPFRDFVAFLKLLSLFRREKFDLVHTHSSKAGILGRWAAWWAGTPVIMHTIHGWGFHDYQPSWVRGLYILLERWTARITERLIAVSKENIRKGIAAGIGDEPKYTTIYSGIDLKTYRAALDTASLRDSLRIPKEKLIVGTLGRLSPQKNPLFFVRLAAALTQRHKNLFFIMIGDGPLRRDVENEIDRRGLRASFLLTGIRADVAALTQLIDIFALTSRWEGLPRALLAAMAAGKPVVAARTDGVMEVLRHNENGLAVPPDQEEAWAAALETFIHDPDLRRRLGAAAQKSVTDQFSDAKMFEDLDCLFRETLRQKGIHSVT